MVHSYLARPCLLIVVAALLVGPSVVCGQNSGGGQGASASPAQAEADTAAAEAATAAVQAVSEALVAAYNAGDVAKLAECFLPKAELVDDAGTVYRGLDEIGAIFQKFREQFPSAKMELAVESIRLAGEELAVEDGTRTVTTDESVAVNKYTMVYVKRDGKWLVASARETAADPEPTPHDRLLPLAWLIGQWVDENAEAAIAIDCRWDDSENFLLIDFAATVEGQVVMKSSQRIGWDPHAERIRSWVFDSDGGYGEGRWANIDGVWVMKSTATMPDGDSGSATIYIEPVDGDKFVMKGFDRIAGDVALPDFEAIIVRKPPEPGK
ncbi:MAG: SgcJ/EcaC family oxidoreductase [Pirellulaceae bacterium]|nr:SgcJ/EcaC family oxidoreductase [Pirellulaceae bacterium]